MTVTQKYTNSNGEIAPPPGSVVMYMGTSSPPSGWLFCDGSSYSRTTYSELYTALGTSYNDSGNASNFKVPDLRNYFVRGAAATGTVSKTALGASSVTLSVSNLPSHTHNVTDPGHSHTIAAVSNVGTYSTGYTMPQLNGFTTMTTSSSTTGITIANTGGGSSFSILPPYYEVNYIIKT